MQEIGFLNRDIAAAIAKQGHTDLLMVTDAGFAIPEGVNVIDISLSVNKPMVMELLEELHKYFSVEKMIISEDTKITSPSHYESMINVWDGVEVELISQNAIREMSKKVKTIIRTGDFTAYGNVILVSGAGDRWYCEK